ncbi:hypothetical protein GmHk_07G019954 [Glycine max]|nr:hypothetical protein GmHk_07G019954 [Glycine max]
MNRLMATPPSSPPPPPPTEAASQSPSTLKRTRKATRLRSLATRPLGANKPVVHVDPSTEKVDDPHKKKLKTYLGIVARDMVDVIYETWKQVSAKIYNLLTIKPNLLFVMLNLISLKHLMTFGERWRQFKSDLTRKWALAANKDSVDDTVCEKYGISKEKWAQFCQTRRDPSWEMRGKRHRPYRSITLPPPPPQQKLLAEKTKKKLEEAAQFGSTEAMIDPPSPIKWHVKWKMARMKKTSQMTSDAAKEIAKKIVRFVGGAGVIGFLCPPWTSGCPNYCHWATGTPWSCACCWSRTRAAHLTNQGPAKGVDHRKSGSAADGILRPNAVLVSVTDGLALPSKPEVSPSAAYVSTKKSCVDPSGNDLETADSDKCELHIKENPPRLVALGRVYEGFTTVHNILLLHDQVKVDVEEVKDAAAPIPVPTDEALNTFLAWPTHLVKRLSKQNRC